MSAKRRLGLSGTRDEKRHRARTLELLERRKAPDGGHLERLDRDFALVAEVERCAARREDLQTRRRPEQVCDERRGLEHVLEAVEEQQHLARSKVPRKQLGYRRPAGLLEPERTADVRGHERRVGDGAQVHDEHPVSPRGQQRPRDLERESRLPGAARPRQRHEPNA